MDEQQPRCSECQFHSWSWLQTPSEVQFVRILCHLLQYFSNIAEIKWPMNNEIMWVKGVYHSQRSPQICRSKLKIDTWSRYTGLRGRECTIDHSSKMMCHLGMDFLMSKMMFFSQKSMDWNLEMTPTVDGSEIRRSPVEVGSLSHYLLGFIHPRWCRISSINSSTVSYFSIISDPKQVKETNVNSSTIC